MTTEYFRIDEYFTAQQDSKGRLAYFVLANKIFKTDKIQGLMGTAMAEGLKYDSDTVIDEARRIVYEEVGKLKEEFGYPFKAEPIKYIVVEMMESQMELFDAGLGNLKEFGKPTENVRLLMELAEKDQAGLKDLIELFGYEDE